MLCFLRHPMQPIVLPAPTPAPAPARNNCSHLSDPDTFDGNDPYKLRPFLTQIYLHLTERLQDFPTDDDKIIYVMSYLRGSAAEWLEPDIMGDNPNTVPVWDGTD